MANKRNNSIREFLKRYSVEIDKIRLVSEGEDWSEFRKLLITDTNLPDISSDCMLKEEPMIFNLDWDGVTDKLPEGIRVIFYPKDGEGKKVDRYLSVRGGEMKVPPGRYSVVAYNYNTEYVQIRGEESYETIEAYTGCYNVLGSVGTEEMVWSPDSLYVLNIDELRIKESEEILHLDWKLKSVVQKYFFTIDVKGLEYVTKSKYNNIINF